MGDPRRVPQGVLGLKKVVFSGFSSFLGSFLGSFFEKCDQNLTQNRVVFQKILKKQFIRQSYVLNELRFLRFKMLNFLGTQKVKIVIFMFLRSKNAFLANRSFKKLKKVISRFMIF